MKTCADCGRTVSGDRMKRNARGRTGRICKACDAARARKHYWHDVDATRLRRREIRNADLHRYRGYRRASRLRHLERERARCREYARSERGRAVNRLAVARWQSANPEKVAASRELRRAVQRGVVRKPTVCEILDCTRAGILHGHHQDYRRPRDVVFACSRHHEEIHHREPLRLKDGRLARAPSPSQRVNAPLDSDLASGQVHELHAVEPIWAAGVTEVICKPRR
ncbi:MAG: hypothetical protein F9K29_03420 [Hyphomicrobiaceae bacterium]|nr:MAG: hypothetical protein F9K29_03420 [Hyphomicrobiaceae bacterium]